MGISKLDKVDILVIGGGPAGITSAISSKTIYPEKKVVLVREKEKGVVPCSIPYVFTLLDSVDKNLISYEHFASMGIELLIDKAINIDPESKIVHFSSGKEIKYEKLILATGSYAHTLPIKGSNKKGVWYIKKDYEYIKKLREEVLRSKNIVIIGGGFIGVELAEELSNIKGANISIIEREEYCLMHAFDEEFAKTIEDKLREKGVRIYTNEEVREIGGKEKVEYVLLRDKKIPADIVIIAVGTIPNVELAKKAGIEIGKYAAIKVNEYMETSHKDIFAVGDCAEKTSMLTKKPVPVMLASTACYEARIAAFNLYRKSEKIKNRGTLPVFATFVGGYAIGVAGLTEKDAIKEGYDIVIGESEAPNHHPQSMPNTTTTKVKLIFLKENGKLIGGQIIGDKSIVEMVNLLALAIQKDTKICDFNNLQIATHPLLTSAPIVYPLILAAQTAFKKMKK